MEALSGGHIVHAEDFRDLNAGWAFIAVVAGGTWDQDIALQRPARSNGGIMLCIGHGRCIEDADIVFHLFRCGHAGQGGQKAGQPVYEFQRIGCIVSAFTGRRLAGGAGCGVIQKTTSFFTHRISQHAAPNRFHDDDRLIELTGNLIEFFHLLVFPVKVVQLQLDEFHGITVLSQHFPEKLCTAVERRTQMYDTAGLLFFNKKGNDIQIYNIRPGLFIDVMYQIKVEILHAAFGKLIFKDGLHIFFFLTEPGRHFVCQIKAFPRMSGQSPAGIDFRVAAVVFIGGINVVDAVRQGIIHHLIYGFLYDLSLCVHRQPHGAEAET